MPGIAVTCRVTSVGISEDGEVIVRLEAQGKQNPHPPFAPSTPFFACPSLRREMLSTALAAMTNGEDVNVTLAGAAPNNQIVSLLMGRAERYFVMPEVKADRCKVLAAGPTYFGDVRIQLADLKTAKFLPGTWFIAHPVAQREMLSTALTAIAAGCDVSVELDKSEAESEIQRICMVARESEDIP